MGKRFVFIGIAILACAGCGQKDGDSVAKQAGSKVGETLTDFATGVGKGVDKQLGVEVEIAKDLSDLGITKTVSKAKPHGFSIYLVASKPLNGTLVAKALNKDGQEIGRSAIEIDFTADDAKYVSFAFQEDMDTQLVEKYALDVKK